MEFLKPDVNRIFAATGSSIAPSNVKINLGWVSEIPDFEFENWIQNRQDSFIAHINQLGIVAWDNATEYIIGKSYVQSSDGLVYKALKTNTNQQPQSNPLAWTLAFNAAGFSYSKSQADGLFAARTSNLSDLSSSGAARTNLSVYSKSESDAKYEEASALVGMVVAFPMTTPPSGWLACNGASVSRLTYAALFSRVGTTFGAGDTSAEFDLPDLRGEFIRGWDDGRTADAGRTLGSAQSDLIKSHNHTASSTFAGSHAHSGTTAFQPSHSHLGSTNVAGDHFHSLPRDKTGVGDNYALFDTQENDEGYSNITPTGNAGSHAHSLNIALAGGHDHVLALNNAGSHNHVLSIDSSGGYETRPRNVALLYCIKH